MRVRDYFRSLRHTLAINRLRSALTLLGIVIGAGSIVTLAGLLRGGEEALVKMNQGVSGSDTLRIRSDEPPAKYLERPRRELSRSDRDALQDSGMSVDVAAESTREARAYWRGKQKRARLVGAAARSRSMYRLTLDKGRFLEDADVLDGRRVAIVGHEIWKELLEENPHPLGLQLNVDNQSWTIVGVLAHKPSMGHGDGTWMWDRKILVPQTAFDAVFQPKHEISSIFMRARGLGADARQMATHAKIAEMILLRRHLGVKNFKVGDEEGGNQEELIITIIEILLLGTGLMSLFVGGINIMNIMLVTVTERTREIGIRRAIGASRGAILAQFVLEAGMVSFIGGLLGVAGGILVSWLVAFGLAQAFGAYNFHVELWSVAAALSLALVTGLGFGLFPAWRAARLDPVEALRYE